MNQSELKLKYNILSEISKSKVPMGASLLALVIDTSQATIGRQLQQLEHSGYLEKLSNKGRIITDKGKEYFNKIENDLVRAQKAQELIEISKVFSKERLLDILKARKILEKETAMLAAKNIKKEELNKLRTLVNTQEIKVVQGVLGDEEDLEFHSLIARIAGNEVVEQLLTLILTQKGAYLEFSFIRQNLPKSTTVGDHKKILQAFEDGNAELAGDVMVNHINKIIEDVVKYFNKKENEINNE